MSKTWADVLEVLPDSDDKRLMMRGLGGCIRCASLDYVRAWCKRNRMLLLIDDLDGDTEIVVTCDIADDLRVIGSGPDEPSAWHAAVEYVKAHQ